MTSTHFFGFWSWHMCASSAKNLFTKAPQANGQYHLFGERRAEGPMRTILCEAPPSARQTRDPEAAEVRGMGRKTEYLHIVTCCEAQRIQILVGPVPVEQYRNGSLLD